MRLLPSQPEAGMSVSASCVCRPWLSSPRNAISIRRNWLWCKLLSRFHFHVCGVVYRNRVHSGGEASQGNKKGCAMGESRTSFEFVFTHFTTICIIYYTRPQNDLNIITNIKITAQSSRSSPSAHLIYKPRTTFYGYTCAYTQTCTKAYTKTYTPDPPNRCRRRCSCC